MAAKHKSAPEQVKELKQKLREEREARYDLTRELTDVPRRQINGFIDFVRERGVVGLAIGLAIGTAASGLVTQIVNAVIVPTINLIIGKEGLDGLNTTISFGSHSEPFMFGDLTEAFIRFMAIAMVIYFVVKGLRLDRLDKKKE